MKKRLPAIYRRAAAPASARAARVARAAGQLRAAGGRSSSTRMTFPGSGGQGGYGMWRALLPGSQHDYEGQAGNLWQNSAVAACLGWIRNNFAEPTLEVVRKLKDGEGNGQEKRATGRGKRSNAGAVQVVPDSQAVALIDRPNPFFDRFTFWSACSMSLIVDGNCYIRKIRDRRHKVVQLWHLPFWMVCPRWNPDGSEYIGFYEYQVNGTLERIEVADMIHLKHGDDNRDGDRVAWSPLKGACREICGLNDAAGFTASILRNMGVPGMIVSVVDPDGGFNQDDMSVVKDIWRENFTSEGRGTTLFMPRAMKVEKVAFSPEELALDRIPAQLESIICALIGVPAMVVGLAASLDRRTFSNYGEARRAAYEDCLIPLQKKVAEGLTNQLLIPDFDEGDRFRWDYSGVQCLLENEDQLADRLGKCYQIYQGITRAEFREALGYDWTDEDEVFYPEAMLRITDEEHLDAGGDTGPNRLGDDSAGADVERVQVDDQVAKDMEAVGSKKSETIDKQLKEQGLGEGPDTGTGRGIDPDAIQSRDGGMADDARAMSPRTTHKASSAEAILAHALKGRGWTQQHRDEALSFDQRHELLADIVDYAEGWLRHEAGQFLEHYGEADDGDRSGQRGVEGDPGCGESADPGRPGAARGAADGAGVPPSVQPDDRRGIHEGPDAAAREVAPRDAGADTAVPAAARGVTDGGRGRGDVAGVLPGGGTGRQADIDLRPGNADVEHGDPVADLRSLDPATAAHLDRLFRRARQFCREAHLAGAMALSGGPITDPADLADLEMSSQDQERYLGTFHAEVVAAPPAEIDSRARGKAMSGPRFIKRIGDYGKDLWGRVINWFRRKTGRDGPSGPGTVIQESRLLDGLARHCSECPELADRGWCEIGTLPGVGSCECHANDRCRFVYREVPSGAPAGPDARSAPCSSSSPVVSGRRLPGGGGSKVGGSLASGVSPGGAKVAAAERIAGRRTAESN